MKLKKILLSIAVVSFFTFLTNVKADAPKNITIDPDKFEEILGSDYLEENTMHPTYKETTDGHVVYCYEIDKDSGAEDSYTLEKELDARFAYALKNGYPSKKITADNKKSYFITNIAIWRLAEPDKLTKFDFENGTYRDESNENIREFINSVNELMSKEKQYKEPSIELHMDNKKEGSTYYGDFVLSSDGKYYISRTIYADGIIDDTYTIELENEPDGTLIIDEDGNESDSFAIGEKFMIKIPAEKISSLTINKLNIKVSASGSIEKAYLYKPADAEHQRVVLLDKDTKDLSAQVSLNNGYADVEISKQDATTGKELPGATLIVKDANGNEIDKWVSGKEPHVVKGLAPGKYTLTEITAPGGYMLNDETVEFTVEDDGTVKEPVIMKNEKEVATGDTLIYVAWGIGLAAIGYSIYYFAKTKKNIKKD